ncbi:MAG: hypothetical protein N2594_07505 [Clostridiales bacterium]|nr:hypothetical protein [Clostridiales bacterium]
MYNYEEQITELKKRIEVAKNKRIKAETRLEQLQNQKKEIIEEIIRLGFKPENIEEDIKKLEQEIQELIQEAEKLLPKNL